MSEFPQENPKPHEDLIHGLEPFDRLIDASLEEILCDARPVPVASAYERIAAGKTSKLLSDNQLDRITHQALLEVLASPQGRRLISKPSKTMWLPIGSLAACIAIGLLLGWWATRPSLDQHTAGIPAPPKAKEQITNPNPTEVQTTIGESSRDGTSANLAESKEFESDRSNPELTESSSPGHLQKRPSDPSTEPPSIASDPPSPAGRKRPLGDRSDREVASVIDSQFEQIWNQPGYQNNKIRNPQLSAERIARLLLRRVPTHSELEALRREKLASEVAVVDQMLGDLTSLTDRWIFSEEFDRVWADSLAKFYLGGDPLVADSQKKFRDWLEEQIRTDVPIQEIQRSVLLGLWQPEHPASCLIDSWSKLSQEPSGRGSHWVDIDQAEVNKLAGISQLFIKVTGNAAIGCTQCHGQEASEYPAWLAELFPTSEKTSITKPVVFDSVSALMLQSVLPGRSELFSKQQDDRISMVMARLPDGKRIGTEDSVQQAVSAWIEKGSHFQSSLIQSIWKDFYGQALHSDFGLDSGVAIQERRDLLEFLSKQAVEKGAGLRQVVYWMLISEPARQPEESLSYPQYMAYDSQKLRDYWTNRSVFKSLLLRPDSRGESEPESIDRFAQSVFPEKADWLERSLLAQPSTPSTSTPKAAEPPDTSSALTASGPIGWGRELLNAELRFRVASDQAIRWARLLAESKLGDQQVVEHVYLMSKHRPATAREHKAWADRGWSRSDRFSAILRLLASIESLEP